MLHNEWFSCTRGFRPSLWASDPTAASRSIGFKEAAIQPFLQEVMGDASRSSLYNRHFMFLAVHWSQMAHTRGVLTCLVLVTLGLLDTRCQAQRDCRVSSFKVQENFDKYQVSDQVFQYFFHSHLLPEFACIFLLLEFDPWGSEQKASNYLTTKPPKLNQLTQALMNHASFCWIMDL